MNHNETQKGLAVATWRCDAEFHRKCRNHAKEARCEVVQDRLGHAARTGSGNESAGQDAADSRARSADSCQEGSSAAASSATATAEQCGDQHPAQAVVRHHAEEYSKREGGRYKYIIRI